MNDDLAEAREELDKEFRQFREQLTKIHQAVDKVDKAGPMDDIEGLLDELEDVVQEVRTGGLIGGGAKGHAKARKKLLELQGKKA